jgi:hypothetical protein
MTRGINSAVHGSMSSGRRRATALRRKFDSDGWGGNIKTDGNGRMYPAPGVRPREQFRGLMFLLGVQDDNDHATR